MKAIRKANVLAVDDQRANLITLDAVLGTEFNLILANSGFEAISILETRQDIDVILMDAQMPVMDGFEAASRIKAMPDCREIPIVFITAVYNEDPFIKQGYKVGAVDYFSKPFDPEILKAKVAIYASFRLHAEMLKERERQIRESEELLHVGRKLFAIIQDLRIGVVITDSTGRVCQANEEFLSLSKELQLFGGSGASTGSGSLQETREWDGGHPAPLAHVLGKGGTFRDSVEVRCTDATTKCLVRTASALRALDGGAVGAVLVIHDMTAHMEVERDLERLLGRFALAGAELDSA